MIAKAVTYAATLAAAGGIFFLWYSHALIRGDEGLRLRRLMRTLAVIAVAAGGVRLLATAASMTGAASGLYDLGLARMILQAGEGRANLVRPARFKRPCQPPNCLLYRNRASCRPNSTSRHFT